MAFKCSSSSYTHAHVHPSCVAHPCIRALSRTSVPGLFGFVLWFGERGKVLTAPMLLCMRSFVCGEPWVESNRYERPPQSSTTMCWTGGLGAAHIHYAPPPPPMHTYTNSRVGGKHRDDTTLKTSGTADHAYARRDCFLVVAAAAGAALPSPGRNRKPTLPLLVSSPTKTKEYGQNCAIRTAAGAKPTAHTTFSGGRDFI